MYFSASELNPHPAGQGKHGVVLIDDLPDFLQVLMVALPLQGDLVDLHLLPLVHEVHAQGRSKNRHLFFPSRLAHGDALVAS
jgi:hypothetical protein